MVHGRENEWDTFGGKVDRDDGILGDGIGKRVSVNGDITEQITVGGNDINFTTDEEGNAC